MSNIPFVANALKIAESVAKAAKGERDAVKGIHPLYDISVEMMKSISYHAKKGMFPESLFTDSSPNSTPQEILYIKENYKQPTLTVFVDYIGTITRPWGDGNWSIVYKEDASSFIKIGSTFQRYVEKELPKYKSLEDFMKFVLPSIKTIDSMGFVGVRPMAIDYVVNESGKEVIDSRELFKPTIFYYDSAKVIDYSENEYFMFLSREKSVTIDGKEGLIFELYMKGEIYFIRQIGNQRDYKFEAIEYFTTPDSQEIAVHQLMGIPTIPDTDTESLLWQSPFLYATDNLDLVLINSNWLQASVKKCVYPHVVMLGNDCDFKSKEGQPCIEGSVKDLEGRKSVCPQCNGSGLKSRLSPLGVLLIKPSSRFSDGDSKSTGTSTPPLQFISPDVESLRFLKSKIAEDELRGRSILKLRNKNSAVITKDDVTATEVRDDEKSMTAFVKPISDQSFTLYEFFLRNIGIQRYAGAFQQPMLSSPKTFDFKSPEDYLKDISDAMTNNLPPSFQQTLLHQYIAAFYGDNTKTIAIFKLIMKADRLWGLTQDEINMKMAKQTISKWQDVLHSSAIYFINELLEKNPKFLDQEIKTQIEELQKLAKEETKKILTDAVDELA